MLFPPFHLHLSVANCVRLRSALLARIYTNFDYQFSNLCDLCALWGELRNNFLTATVLVRLSGKAILNRLPSAFTIAS